MHHTRQVSIWVLLVLVLAACQTKNSSSSKSDEAGEPAAASETLRADTPKCGKKLRAGVRTLRSRVSTDEVEAWFDKQIAKHR